MKIKVTYPTVNYGSMFNPQLEEDRQQVWGSRLAIRITRPCIYCKEPVSYLRGNIFNGEKYHWDCYLESGDHKKEADAFQKSVCGNLTPAEYQRKHGIAWNE